MKLKFIDRTTEVPHISNFMKVCPLGDELFHPEGRVGTQIDMTKLNLVFMVPCIM